MPSPEVARARARLAGLVSNRSSPEAIGRARADLAAAKARSAVLEMLGLPAADRMQLAGLLLTGGGGDATD
jgi:hypothetical protein